MYFDQINVRDRELNASRPVLIARMKRDLKTLERLLNREDWKSAQKAWAISCRLEIRADMLSDLADEAERRAHLPWDFREYEESLRTDG